MTLPSAAEVEHADWPSLKTFATGLGLNPKGRSGLVRQRVLDHLRTQPRGPEWRAGKAEQAALLTRIGSAELAASLWESTISLDAPAPWVGLGTAYAKAGRIEEALKCYDRAIGMGDAGARLHKANALMQAGRSDAAAAEVETTLAANPGNVRAWAVRAVIAEAGGDPQRIHDSHAKIAELGGARLGLAKMLMRAGRYEEADRALADHLMDHADDAVAWNQRGVCLVKRGLWREAVDALKKAAALRPKDAGILNNLAVALASSDRTDEALKRLAAACRIAEDPRILLNQAALLERTGARPEAREAISRVVHIAPEHPEAVEAWDRLAPGRAAPRMPRKELVAPPKKKSTRKTPKARRTKARSSKSPAKKRKVSRPAAPRTRKR